MDEVIDGGLVSLLRLHSVQAEYTDAIFILPPPTPPNPTIQQQRIILESESELVVDRVSLRGIENPTEAGPINEQNIADVLARARDIFLG